MKWRLARGRGAEDTLTYRWREFCDDGNYEPDDTLTNKNTSVSREHGSW